MTWIVAGPGILFPFMAGDIRVTFGTREEDCLLKIYPIATNIIAGFAGSVRIGLTTLEVIARRAEEGYLYSLPILANGQFPRILRRVFKAAPAAEQALGSQFLMLGSHPKHDRGMEGQPQGHVFKFSSPGFNPTLCGHDEVLGIGSGGQHEHVVAAARNLLKSEAFDKMIMVGLGAPAEMLAGELHKTLVEKPIPGVSTHFVYASVSNHELVISPYARTIYEPDGRVWHDAPPVVARGPEEFVAFCKKHGLSAKASCARWKS